MGGTRSKVCNSATKLIWDWAQQHKVWLTVAYIPGIQNKIADAKSRVFKDHLEWSLNTSLYDIIINKWGPPTVDLFASRNNAKVKRFVSWHLEPESWRVDTRFPLSGTTSSTLCSLPSLLSAESSERSGRTKPMRSSWSQHGTQRLAGAKRLATDAMFFPRNNNNLRSTGPIMFHVDVATTPLWAFLF